MKKIFLPMIILVGCLFIANSIYGASTDMETFFPQIKGWKQKGKPNIFMPDNLFEYINGAAEVYLSYDFQKLITATFENNKKNSFTIDIYRHSNLKNGFGIYSQEKPQKGPFLAIGAQGYYEKGVLNFLKSSYYIKLSSYGLGEQDKIVLVEAARQVAKKLDGENRFPKTVESFPKEGKKDHSERYIAKNFMGHSFLHSAFVAEYEKDGRKFQVFIIETEDEKGTQKLLESYLRFVKSRGIKVDTLGGKNFYRFQDPYYRSSGEMNIKQKGRYLWGLFCKSSPLAEFYIEKIEENLIKLNLICSTSKIEKKILE